MRGTDNHHGRLIIALSGAVMLLCACARPYVQPEGATETTPALHDTYALMDDGYRLPLTRWIPEGRCRVQVLALHGLNDYRRAFASTGEFLSARGITVLAYDQRGFGESDGFGLWHGSDRLASDLQLMVRLLHREQPGCPVYVLGESMGGAVALAALDRIAADIEGVILVAPAVWSRDSMPLYQRAALWLAAHTVPAKQLTGEGLDITPSDNIEMLRALGRDPHVIKATRVDVLYGISNLMDQAADASPAQAADALLLYGMHDEIIPREPTCRLLGKPAVAHWDIVLYENGYHMLTRDLQAERVLRDIADWLLDATRHKREATDRLTQFCAASPDSD
ncbi:MAG TPA: alpha/beta fold hydrolase [Gammaproteobacteria bacterium]|nr:alpha/beta fold hydrolase [Gammaproteobacteria bacterium]